ncbi:hypothetical protein PR202_ga24784 [Eleusine coracana subsp. coracana]|uniref:RING-type domain-containing protein n=1 Tax=Eleusine coracana subsp. coracana TaxID=191504 RepID=A0AAV5D8M2_ELECO|nr:hypothetical protein PR202_ga24784 [Eleusine coracana subsp. coracana]
MCAPGPDNVIPRVGNHVTYSETNSRLAHLYTCINSSLPLASVSDNKSAEIPDGHMFPSSNAARLVSAMADETTEQVGLPAATEKSAAAHASAGAEQDACDAEQIGGMTFQALREAGTPATVFPPPDNADESTEHALAAAAADTTAATRDEEAEVPEEREAADDDVQEAHQDSEQQHQFTYDDEDEGPGELDPVQVEFVRRVLNAVRHLSDPDGYPDDVIYEMALAAIPRSWLPRLFDELPSYRNGGFGAVPASADAVDALEKRVFHAGGGGDDHGGCAICLEEEFEEGQELSVMPCSKAHAFHTVCITLWLGQSNMCPLCRHPLPATED